MPSRAGGQHFATFFVTITTGFMCIIFYQSISYVHTAEYVNGKLTVIVLELRVPLCLHEKLEYVNRAG